MIFKRHPQQEEPVKFVENNNLFTYFSILVTILVLSVIFILVALNIREFYSEKLKYSYEVDFDYDAKLKLNVDITVAMTCNGNLFNHIFFLNTKNLRKDIGADVLDKSSKDIISSEGIHMEDTWFELSPNQQKNFEHISQSFEKIRNDYHAIHSSLWNSYSEIPKSLGPR